MSVFAGAKKGRVVTKKDQNQINNENQLGARFAAVKSVLEHFGLYVGLACYTALGAKVLIIQLPLLEKEYFHFSGFPNVRKSI